MFRAGLFAGAIAIVVARHGAALALRISGTPGSPSATTSLDGRQLPPPDPKFGGVIKNDALQSKAWWAPRVVPPKGAPNILLIITDDAGFGVPGTFGGVIPMPTMDASPAKACATTASSPPPPSGEGSMRVGA
jgi:arylsulfatase